MAIQLMTSHLATKERIDISAQLVVILKLAANQAETIAVLGRGGSRE